MTVDFDPVLFSLGPLQVRWYGLMYMVGFFVGGQLLNKLASENIFSPGKKRVDSLVMHLIIGMLIGARLAYVFIYNWEYYQNHLGEIFAVWQGGLSFHGAITGMAVACIIFSKKHKVSPLEVTDACVVAGAQGIFFGRMGNFINGELYGRVTNSAVGMIFKNGGPMPRHASQLYEGISEGVILWLILWMLRKKASHYGILTAIFLSGYGVFRFIVEFFREPDSQLGYYFGGALTMGQILCLVQIAAGLAVMFLFRSKESLQRKALAV